MHISKLVLHDLLKGKGMQLQSLETGAVEEKPFWIAIKEKKWYNFAVKR